MRYARIAGWILIPVLTVGLPAANVIAGVKGGKYNPPLA